MVELTVISMIVLGLVVLALAILAGVAFNEDRGEVVAGVISTLFAIVLLSAFFAGTYEMGTGLPDDAAAFDSGEVYTVLGVVDLKAEDQFDGNKVIVLIRHPDGKKRAHAMKTAPPPIFTYSYADGRSIYTPYPER